MFRLTLVFFLYVWNKRNSLDFPHPKGFPQVFMLTLHQARLVHLSDGKPTGETDWSTLEIFVSPCGSPIAGIQKNPVRWKNEDPKTVVRRGFLLDPWLIGVFKVSTRGCKWFNELQRVRPWKAHKCARETGIWFFRDYSGVMVELCQSKRFDAF